MPHAITLQLDAGTAAVVRGMWRALAGGGFDGECHVPGYAPHVTLAIYPDGAPVAELRRALQAEADAWTTPPCALAGLAVFPHPSPAIWVASPAAHGPHHACASDPRC